MNWLDSYCLRPEQIYIGPRRCGKSTVVAHLRSKGYFAHEHTTESGEEIIRIYAAQRKLYEQDPGGKLQPRMFFSDGGWWQHSARFHYVNPHLRSEISFPEQALEDLLPEAPIDWLYRWGADARDRLIPELAVGIWSRTASGELSESGAPKVVAGDFLEMAYPELVPILTYAVPQANKSVSRMQRTSFESRVRSFRTQYELPHKLTASNLIEYLIAVGICEYVNSYYLRFAPVYAIGIQEVKNRLTREALSARMKGRQ